MRRIIKMVLIAVVLQVSGAEGAYTGPNRVVKPSPESYISNLCYRHVPHLHGEICEQRRKHALDLGCISEEEYIQLKEFQVVPFCEDFGEGLDFAWWCVC